MILLTGATGFIGRHVLALLLERGDTVVTFGRSAPHPVAPAHSARHQHVTGDLSTGENLEQLPWTQLSAVIHLAAAGVKASDRAWPQALAVNVIGTQRLLEALRLSGASPTLFAARTFYESFSHTHPALLANPYIATKAAATELIHLFAPTYTGRIVLGTFFQVYGPGDDPGNVLSYAAQEFTAGRQATFGSGLGQRDWIHIQDAARAVLASLNQAATLTQSNPTSFDIGTGELRSLREMVEQLHLLSPTAPPPLFDPTRDRPDVGITARALNLPPSWQSMIDPKIGLKTLLITP